MAQEYEVFVKEILVGHLEALERAQESGRVSDLIAALESLVEIRCDDRVVPLREVPARLLWRIAEEINRQVSGQTKNSGGG